jgi:hypothetical protein
MKKLTITSIKSVNDVETNQLKPYYMLLEFDTDNGKEIKLINFKQVFNQWIENNQNSAISNQLLDSINLFNKVSISNGNLCWKDIKLYFKDDKDSIVEYFFELDNYVLYELSNQFNEELEEMMSIIMLLNSGIIEFKDNKFILKDDNEYVSFEEFIKLTNEE